MRADPLAPLIAQLEALRDQWKQASVQHGIASDRLQLEGSVGSLAAAAAHKEAQMKLAHCADDLQAVITALRQQEPADSPTPASDGIARLRELAQQFLFWRHHSIEIEKGHTSPFDTCPHPDCRLVREPLPVAAALPARGEEVDLGMVAAHMHNWATDLRSALGELSEEGVRAVADDLDLNANALWSDGGEDPATPPPLKNPEGSCLVCGHHKSYAIFTNGRDDVLGPRWVGVCADCRAKVNAATALPEALFSDVSLVLARARSFVHAYAQHENAWAVRVIVDIDSIQLRLSAARPEARPTPPTKEQP